MKKRIDFKMFSGVAKIDLMRSKTFTFLLVGIAISGTCSAAPKTREECRASRTQSDVVSCIERGLYDPCDDAGGSWGRAQCAWAWVEILNRKVENVEREILSRLRKGKVKLAAQKQFRQSQKDWRSYRDSHCSFTNATVGIEQFTGTSSSHVGFCRRRVTEQRVVELEAIIAKHE